MKAKPIELINLKTGQVIKAKSITEFCRKAQLYKRAKNAKYHLTFCLRGKYGFYKNWAKIETYDRLNTLVSLKDSNGNLYQFSGMELAKKLKRRYVSVLKFLSGSVTCFRGLYLIDTEIKGIKPITRFQKTYFRRGGQILAVEKLKDFGEKYDISVHSLCDLKYGKKAIVKGFEWHKGVEKDQRIIK